MARFSAWLTLVLCLCFATGVVRAHAPMPRRVALNRDASTIALSLPGFGLLFRARAEQPFAYLCDALLGLKPSDNVPSLAFLGDGTLLLGSADGIRVITPLGCPRADLASELSAASVVALAVSSGATETAYAVATGSAAGLWQSRDGGQHWTLRSSVDASELTNALMVSASDPNRLYLGQRAASSATVLASTDGGASWTKFPQEQPLTLLSADGRAPYPLWAMARDALTVGNRGFAILRAASPSGPWQTMLRVNYFGGFVVDAQGVIWVGDEIGGIYRSEDGGESFRNLEPEADVACLASAGEALWACTPGTLKEPALQRLGAGAPLSEVVALAAVDQLVACPDLDVTRTCAAAWVEWQRDVRQLPSAGADAGVSAPQDAAEPMFPDAGQTSGESVDAMAAEEGAAPSDQVDASTLRPVAREPSDCSLAPARSGRSAAPRLVHALGWLIAAALILRARRRNARRAPM
jgi:hypothetical protein